MGTYLNRILNWPIVRDMSFTVCTQCNPMQILVQLNTFSSRLTRLVPNLLLLYQFCSTFGFFNLVYCHSNFNHCVFLTSIEQVKWAVVYCGTQTQNLWAKLVLLMCWFVLSTLVMYSLCDGIDSNAVRRSHMDVLAMCIKQWLVWNFNNKHYVAA